MPAATAIRGDAAARSGLMARITAIPYHPVRISPPLLRTADGHDLEDRRASWLELYLDLVFAGAVGQLAGAFQEQPGMTALARFVLLFTPIWWLWVQLTFYADRHESDDAVHRAAVLTAILLCVGLAVSAPRAIAGDTAGFVAFFVCLRGVQLALYARARRHIEATRALYTRYLIFFGAGGVLWLSSLSVAGPARYAVWAAGLLQRRGRCDGHDVTAAPRAVEHLAPGRPFPDLCADRARRVRGPADQRRGTTPVEPAAGSGARRGTTHTGGAVADLADGF